MKNKAISTTLLVAALAAVILVSALGALYAFGVLGGVTITSTRTVTTTVGATANTTITATAHTSVTTTVTNTTTVYLTYTTTYVTVTNSTTRTLTTTLISTSTITNTEFTTQTSTLAGLPVGSSFSVNGTAFHIIGAEWSAYPNSNPSSLGSGTDICFISSGSPLVYGHTYMELNASAPRTLDGVSFSLLALKENLSTMAPNGCVLQIGNQTAQPSSSGSPLLAYAMGSVLVAAPSALYIYRKRNW